MCAVALHYFEYYILLFHAAEYSIEKRDSSLYIHSHARICITRYQGSPKHHKRAKALLHRSGLELLLRAAAIYHRQGADGIFFYFVCGIQNKRRKSENKNGDNLTVTTKKRGLRLWGGEVCLKFSKHTSYNRHRNRCPTVIGSDDY